MRLWIPRYLTWKCNRSPNRKSVLSELYESPLCLCIPFRFYLGLPSSDQGNTIGTKAGGARRREKLQQEQPFVGPRNRTEGRLRKVDRNFRGFGSLISATKLFMTLANLAPTFTPLWRLQLILRRRSQKSWSGALTSKYFSSFFRKTVDTL